MEAHATPSNSQSAMPSPLAPEWHLYTNPNTEHEMTIRIPEQGVLNISYTVTYGDAAGVNVQVWLPTASERLVANMDYQFAVEPGATISLVYAQEYTQVSLKYSISPLLAGDSAPTTQPA